jgi:hypothetical protein
MSVVGPISSLALGGQFLLVAGGTSWAARWPAAPLPGSPRSDGRGIHDPRG